MLYHKANLEAMLLKLAMFEVTHSLNTYLSQVRIPAELKHINKRRKRKQK